MVRKIKFVLFIILAIAGMITFAKFEARGQMQKGESVPLDKELEGNIHAPDFPPGVQWLNTNRSHSLEEFRGKMVLLDFWTFCCINCMHIIPDLERLEAKYPEDLVIIGVHSAKFTNEKGTSQIRQAILRYGIKHLVVNDANFDIWNEYTANAWPTLVLINPKGKIIARYSGEGVFNNLDPVISKAVTYFKARGDLKPSPVKLNLEMTKEPNTVLLFPGKIVADRAGNRLFIADSDHNRIIIARPGGEIIDVIGNGLIGAADGSFDQAEFHHPQGMYHEGDSLFIADTENHDIRLADLKSRTVKTVLGTGKQAQEFNIAGTGTSVALNSPWDLLVHDGKLYIAMAGSHQIWVADLKSFYVRPFAGSGREGRFDGRLSSAALAQPSGITTDGKKLYFVDSESSSVRSADFSVNGEVETIIGVDLFDFGDIDGPALTARLQHPLGITYRNGLLYITDTYNSKIKIIDPVKKTSVTYAGTGKHGYVDSTLIQSEFNEPAGLAFLGNRLYIADANNHQIRVIDTQSGQVSNLQLTNLDHLARMTMQTFNGRIVELPPQKIAAGMGTISFSVRLPHGYEFTKDAPFFFDWNTNNKKAIKFNATPDQFDFSKAAFPINIPVTVTSGTGELDLDAVVYFCRANSTACLFDNLRIKVPVEAAKGASNRLNLDVEAKTTAM